jgi:hypothetical protein
MPQAHRRISRFPIEEQHAFKVSRAQIAGSSQLPVAAECPVFLALDCKCLKVQSNRVTNRQYRMKHWPVSENLLQA